MAKTGFFARPATTLIASCFIISGVLRVLDPSSAFAVEAEKFGAETTDDAAAPAAAESFVDGPEGYRAMLAAITERQTQLDAQEKHLTERARVLEVAETRLREQMKILEEAENRLGALLRVADDAATKDVEKLVATFQSMDAKRAGPIFESMDVAFAAGLISRMEDEAAANILGALSPEQAYSITAFVASQNARAPKN